MLKIDLKSGILPPQLTSEKSLCFKGFSFCLYIYHGQKSDKLEHEERYYFLCSFHKQI